MLLRFQYDSIFYWRKFVDRLIEKLEGCPDNFHVNYHSHLFQYAKTTHLYNNGATLLIIKEFLRHSSVVTTEIYATPVSKKIREQNQRS